MSDLQLEVYSSKYSKTISIYNSEDLEMEGEPFSFSLNIDAKQSKKLRKALKQAEG